MAEISDYLENALINGTLRGTTYPAPASVYVGLYTSDPTDANTGTEVSGGSYARVVATFAAPADGLLHQQMAYQLLMLTLHSHKLRLTGERLDGLAS